MGKKYRGNGGENISKLFYLESKEKKRIGSNIYSRASTRKGGGNQPLRTPYYYMPNKEKKKLNGEVKTLDMNTILNVEEFNNLDQDMKKKLMIHWRDKYSVNEIKKEMNVSNVNYYKILEELKIERDKGHHRAFNTLEDHEVEEYKSKIVPYEDLLSITPEQRYGEILKAYFERYSIAQLSNAWGLPKQRIYVIKNQTKKHNEVKIEEEENDDIFNIIEKVEKEEEKIMNESINNENNVNDNTEDIAVTPQELKSEAKSSFFFTINQGGNSESIIKKLNMLVSLLEGEDDDYEISLTVKNK